MPLFRLFFGLKQAPDSFYQLHLNHYAENIIIEVYFINMWPLFRQPNYYKEFYYLFIDLIFFYRVKGWVERTSFGDKMIIKTCFHKKIYISDIDIKILVSKEEPFSINGSIK